MTIGIYFKLNQIEHKLKNVWLKIAKETNSENKQLLLEHEQDLFFSLLAFTEREKEALEFGVYLEKEGYESVASYLWDDNLRERERKIVNINELEERIKKIHSRLEQNDFGEVYNSEYQWFIREIGEKKCETNYENRK